MSANDPADPKPERDQGSQAADAATSHPTYDQKMFSVGSTHPGEKQDRMVVSFNKLAADANDVLAVLAEHGYQPEEIHTHILVRLPEPYTAFVEEGQLEVCDALMRFYVHALDGAIMRVRFEVAEKKKPGA